MGEDREKKLFEEIDRRDVGWSITTLVLLVLAYLFLAWLLNPDKGFGALTGQLVLDVLANVIPIFLAFLVAFFLLRRSQRLRAEKELEELSSHITTETHKVLKAEANDIASKLNKTEEKLEIHVKSLEAEVRAQRQFLESIQQVSADQDEFVDNFEQASLDNWMYTGKWRVEQDGSNYFLTVTDSEVGGIAKSCLLWTDYEFEFETKIVHFNTSWIIRANNPLNCVMLQCGSTELNPHFRANGVWFRSDAISLPVELPTNTWFRVRLTVKGWRVAVTIVTGEQEIEVLDEYMLEPPLKIIPLEPNGPDKLLLSYPVGSVGFRAWEDEIAYFRNVRVTKI